MNTLRALIMILLASVAGCATATCWINPFVAVEAGDVQALQRYLDAGGSAGLTDPERGSLMFMAVYLEQNAIAKLLIDKGADFLREPGRLYTRQHPAIVEERIEILKAMLDDYPDSVYKRRNGFTPLMVAAAEGADKSAKLLIEHGADVSALSTSKGGKPEPRTALYYAIVQKHFEVAEMIDVTLNQENIKGQRCGPEAEVLYDLELAKRVGKLEVAQNLEKYCHLGLD